jgi:hypothetical protein
MPEVKEFSDHFGSVSSSYAKFRPTYPADLFAWLVSIVPGHDAAWYKLEMAKRRLVYTLLTLRLPVRDKTDDPELGLSVGLTWIGQVR